MDVLQISLTVDEVGSICSALNEVLECVEDWEFKIRLGRSKEEIEELLRKMQEVGPARIS